MYTISQEPGDGILTMITSGFWPLEELQAFWKDVDRFLAPMRKKGVPVRALLEFNGTVVQSKETLNYAEMNWPRMFENVQDRAAMLVASALVRSQMRRLFETPQCQIFTERHMALAWLNADV